MDLDLLPIHDYPEYLLQCCDLINDEWKRSQTARLRSLESSCNFLPTSLVLVKNKKVIGHVKLSKIPSIKDACFIESVVIDKSLRGKGFGSILMTKAEEYCRNLQLNFIYLSTHGQEEFYRKLQYQECEPVSIYGSYMPPKDLVANKSQEKQSSQVITPPPPPPPLPISKTINEKKTFMKKQL